MIRVRVIRLSVIRRLEAESIHIFREVAAECERPVMLYSVGRIPRRCAPRPEGLLSGEDSFPLLHVDTAYKFPEMYEFRDRFCREIGADLRVYRYEEALQGKPIRGIWGP